MELKELKLVPCYSEYWEFVRELRSDPRVQDGFIDKVLFIDKDDQMEYMVKNWHYYFICLWGTEFGWIPVGYVGIINDDIRVCVHPDYQQLGIGKFMLTELKKENIWSKHSIAKIKIENEASIKLFESCGFKQKYIIMEQNNET